MDRRDFLRGAVSLGAFCGLPRVTLGETALGFDEPLLALIEETPREKLVEAVAARIRDGAAYRDVVAALLLAGVRNVRPRPVGFKFHAVMVVHACHQASRAAARDEDRWLPILWAIDHFKGPQAEEKRSTGWTLGKLDASKIPAKPREAFIAAMDAWDEEAADLAAAGLARLTQKEAFELFARYAARDFRHIGHKSIYVAGAFRLFDLIGWERAEPVLRSLAFALLAREGGRDAEAAWERLPSLSVPESWRGGTPDDAAALDILGACRAGSDQDVVNRVLELLKKGVAPSSIWDGLHLHSGELLMRRPNIPSLHEVTMGNATRYLFDATSDVRLLLQTAAFAPLFRGRPVDGVKLDELEAVEGDPFADVPNDRLSAARKALKAPPEKLVAAARQHLLLKGRDVHDFKFVEAALEDQSKMSSALRRRFLAASMYWAKGAGSPDNGLVDRIRAAFKG